LKLKKKTKEKRKHKFEAHLDFAKHSKKVQASSGKKVLFMNTVGHRLCIQ
jgi:hypothetical protein